jgi:hypothetical protein
MSRRSAELASAAVRTQLRLRASEKDLQCFVQEGKADQPRLHSKHQDLLTAITVAKNDLAVIERSMKAESERPFDLITKMVMRDA